MGLLRQKKKKKGFLPKLVIFLLIVWAGSGLYLSYKGTKKIENLVPPTEETKILNLIKFFPSYNRELANVDKIIKGEKPSEKKGWLFNSTYKTIAKNLLTLQKINEFNQFIEYLYNREKKPELNYYYGLYLFNKGEFEQAKPFLKDKAEFKEIYKTNKLPVIKGVLYYNIKNKTYHSKYKGLKFLEKIFPEKRNYLIVYKSTINPEVQDIAEITMGNNEGFFAFARQGQIIAMVANKVDPLNSYYEPGSVIKLITLTAYLSENRDDVKFPFYCVKPLNIDGKPFYDWKKHGKIPSFEEALACSCNLVFGECGLSLGKSALMKWYSRFYIDGNKKIKFLEKEFVPAKIQQEITDRYSLAEAGVGLEVPTVTPYWLIKTASTFARGGRDSFPEIATFTHVLGVNQSTGIVENMSFTLHNEKDFIFDLQKIKPVYRGMEKAVELPIGTGKRAKVDWIKLMLKTGTAGEKPLNSFIIGVARYNNADYSFALFLKHGGKAEYKAAQTIHNFFKSYKNVFFEKK